MAWHSQSSLLRLAAVPAAKVSCQLSVGAKAPKAKSPYLLTLQASRYGLLALHGRAAIDFTQHVYSRRVPVRSK